MGAALLSLDEAVTQVLAGGDPGALTLSLLEMEALIATNYGNRSRTRQAAQLAAPAAPVPAPTQLSVPKQPPSALSAALEKMRMVPRPGKKFPLPSHQMKMA